MKQTAHWWPLTFFTIEKKHKAWWIYRQYEKGRPALIFGAQKVLPLTFFPDITQKKTFVSSLLICFHCSSQSRFVTSRCLTPRQIWSVQYLFSSHHRWVGHCSLLATKSIILDVLPNVGFSIVFVFFFMCVPKKCVRVDTYSASSLSNPLSTMVKDCFW